MASSIAHCSSAVCSSSLIRMRSVSSCATRSTHGSGAAMLASSSCSAVRPVGLAAAGRGRVWLMVPPPGRLPSTGTRARAKPPRRFAHHPPHRLGHGLVLCGRKVAQQRALIRGQLHLQQAVSDHADQRDGSAEPRRRHLVQLANQQK